MICSLCESAGAPRLGTAKKGYRDGLIQPAVNFSAAVRRGDYGAHMTEPLCLQHTSPGQNDHVESLGEETNANRDCSDTSESEREKEEPSEDDKDFIQNDEEPEIVKEEPSDDDNDSVEMDREE